MNKKLISIILINVTFILSPIIVKAENMEVLSETTKYYKTITTYNNSYSNISTTALNDNTLASSTVEVSKSEYDQENVNTISAAGINALGSTSVETTYKKMTTTIYKVDTYYRYKVTLTWKNMPKVRSYDVIAIGYPASVRKKGSPSFRNEYCFKSGDCDTVKGFSHIYTGENGMGVVFKLPTGSLKTLKQSLTTDIDKNTTYKILKQTAVGDYAHAVKSISLATAKKFYVDMAGINFNTANSINSYDDIERADVTISCNW